jgi:hypothetical protein
MGKYVYLSFIMWKPGGNPEIWAKMKKQLENDKVKLLSAGPVFGVLEDMVLIHKSDLELSDFIDFRGKALTVDGESWVDHARTITSTPN